MGASDSTEPRVREGIGWQWEEGRSCLPEEGASVPVWGASLGVGVTLLSLSLFEATWGPASPPSFSCLFSLSQPGRTGDRRVTCAAQEGLRTDSRKKSWALKHKRPVVTAGDGSGAEISLLVAWKR